MGNFHPIPLPRLNCAAKGDTGLVKVKKDVGVGIRRCFPPPPRGATGAGDGGGGEPRHHAGLETT